MPGGIIEPVAHLELQPPRFLHFGFTVTSKSSSYHHFRFRRALRSASLSETPNRPAEYLYLHNEHDVPVSRTRAAFPLLWSFGRFSDSPSCCSRILKLNLWLLLLMHDIVIAVERILLLRRRYFLLHLVIAAKRERTGPGTAWGRGPTVHRKIIFSCCFSYGCKTTMDILWFHTSVSAHSFVRIIRMPAIVGQKLF